MQTEIVNVGPIERITIPLPPRGGLVVFRGANGVGKSHALEAIDSALSGHGKLPVRDGELQAEVNAHGVTLRVGRGKSRTGEAEVHTLEGRFNLAHLVDPGIADPEKADAIRVKALVQLAGVKADPALFHQLLGTEEFDAVVSPATRIVTDVVAMAGAVKRDIEAAARKSEDQAKNAAQAEAAARRAIGDVDLSAPDDARALQAALTAAITARERLIAEARRAEKARQDGDAAKARIEQAKSEWKGPTVEDARLAEKAAKESLEIARFAVEEAKRAYDRACENMTRATWLAEQSERARENAERIEANFSQWQAQIDAAASVREISRSEIESADHAVSVAEQAVEVGAIVRKAKTDLADAELHAEKRRGFETHAKRLREAAAGTEQVLSSLVSKAGVAMQVRAIDRRMRLTVQTDRGTEPFAELSHGERWRVALEIAITAVGPGGEITIPQDAFEGLDPEARRAIAQQLEAAGVIAYTAEAAEGTLRAEIFNGHAE